MLDFVIIDIETANSDIASICQVGIASFKNGEIVNTWSTFVNPNVRFSSRNTKIHGIRKKDVAKSPTIHEVADKIKSKLDGNPVASYTLFDRRALEAAMPGFTQNIEWIDVTDIVRSFWPQFGYRGYALKPMAERLNIQNKNHHDALNDAIVAGTILISAVKESEQSFSWWRGWLKSEDDFPENIASKTIFKEYELDKQRDIVDNTLSHRTFDVGVAIPVGNGRFSGVNFKFWYSTKDRLKTIINAISKRQIDDASAILGVTAAWDLTEALSYENVSRLLHMYPDSNKAIFMAYMEELKSIHKKENPGFFARLFGG